jgi:hypothetical protein
MARLTAVGNKPLLNLATLGTGRNIAGPVRHRGKPWIFATGGDTLI